MLFELMQSLSYCNGQLYLVNSPLVEHRTILRPIMRQLATF